MRLRALRIMGCIAGGLSLILATVSIFSAASGVGIPSELFTVVFVTSVALGQLAVFFIVSAFVLSAVVNSDERCVEMYLRGSRDAMDRLASDPPDNVRRIS